MPLVVFILKQLSAKMC